MTTEENVKTGMRRRKVRGGSRRIYISVYDEDIAAIDRADINQAGRSATVRRIIREWDQLRPLVQDAELLRTFADLDGTSVADTLHRILRTYLRQPARVLVDTGESYDADLS